MSQQKKCKCPCGTENIYTEPSWDEAIAENLPVNVATAVGVTIISALTGGIGGLIAGGILYADNVIRYTNGVTITCANCGREIKVS